MGIIYNIINSLWFKIVSRVLCVIIIFEIQLRIFAPVPIVPRYVTGTSFGIRGNMPNMNYWHKTPDVKINIRTNSKGIRADEEIPYEKPKDVKRIVVLGDSFGMGYEVNLEDTFLSRMKENLERAGKKVQIVNLSVSGHGNAEELLMFVNEGVKYKPDLVLLCWHRTDYDDNVRSKLFVLENGLLKRNAKTYLPGVRVSDMLYRIPLFIPISENSHAYNMIRDKAGAKIKELLSELRILQAVIIGTEIISNDNQKSDSNNSTMFASTPSGKIDEEFKETKEKFTKNDNLVDNEDYSEILTVSLLNKIDEECKKMNAKFIVLDIPDQKSRYDFISKFPYRLYKKPVVSPIYKLHNNIVNGELFINEQSHGHFTPKACRLVGDALSEYIVNNRFLLIDN